MDNETSQQPFAYFISKRNGFLVASLLGAMDLASIAQIEILKAEISSTEAVQKVILNFKDLVALPPEAIPALAQLQKTVRDKQSDLKLCGLRPEIKARLEKAGILRPLELTDDLQTAILSMASSLKKTA